MYGYLILGMLASTSASLLQVSAEKRAERGAKREQSEGERGAEPEPAAEQAR